MKTRLKLEACIFIDVIRHPKLNRPEYRHPQFYILKYLLRKLSPRVTLFSGTYPFTLGKCFPPGMLHYRHVLGLNFSLVLVSCFLFVCTAQ